MNNMEMRHIAGGYTTTTTTTTTVAPYSCNCVIDDGSDPWTWCLGVGTSTNPNTAVGCATVCGNWNGKCESSVT